MKTPNVEHGFIVLYKRISNIKSIQNHPVIEEEEPVENCCSLWIRNDCNYYAYNTQKYDSVCVRVCVCGNCVFLAERKMWYPLRKLCLSIYIYIYICILKRSFFHNLSLLLVWLRSLMMDSMNQVTKPWLLRKIIWTYLLMVTRSHRQRSQCWYGRNVSLNMVYLDYFLAKRGFAIQ